MSEKAKKGPGRPRGKTEWLAVRLEAGLVRRWTPFIEMALSEGLVQESSARSPRFRVEEAIRTAIDYCSGRYEKAMERRIWNRIDERVRHHIAQEIIRSMDVAGVPARIEITADGQIGVRVMPTEGGADHPVVGLGRMDGPDSPAESMRDLWPKKDEKIC